MLQLPIELRRECFESLNDDTESLKALRLVNKELGTLAAENLFRTATLNHTDESADRFTLLNQSKFSSLVRCVVINTSNDPELMNEGPQEESEVLEAFREGIILISNFENVNEVQLKFARECVVDDPDMLSDEIAETVAFRTSVLELVATAVRNAEKLKSLTIKNLQDYHDRGFFENDDFVAAREKLGELHLQITTEIDWAADEHTFSKPACHSGFGSDLPELWLKPMTEQLMRLTLYSLDCPWGVAPFVDLRTIPTFTHLKSLCLGRFTIAHDWQMDWILAHGSTLEELRLDNCPIVFAMTLDHEQAARNFPSLLPVVGNRPDAEDHSKQYFKKIDLRWHHIFDRLRVGVPRLRDFVLGFGDWDENRAFEERYNLSPWLHRSRYYYYDNVSASRWRYNDYLSSEETWSFDLGPKTFEVEHPKCNEEDMSAFMLLVMAVQERSIVSA